MAHLPNLCPTQYIYLCFSNGLTNINLDNLRQRPGIGDISVDAKEMSEMMLLYKINPFTSPPI